MSFETVAAMSLAIEVIVILGITLTLLNAFTDGRVAGLFSGLRTRSGSKQATALSKTPSTVESAEVDAHPLRRAA